MIVEVKVPEVGESVTSGVISAWLRPDGAWVEPDDELFELETDKVTMPVTSVHAGRLQVRVPAGLEVAVGQVVATIDTSAQHGTAHEAGGGPVQPNGGARPLDGGGMAATVVRGNGRPPAPALAPRRPEPRPEPSLSPSVRRLLREHGLDPRDITGTGRGGRIRREDVLQAVADAAPPPPASAEVPPAAEAPEGAARQTRTRMSRLRLRLAERLVEAQRSAAILTTFNEADLGALLALRERLGPAFQERHGVGLGLMSFFVKAAVEALRAVPELNAQIQGEDLVQNHYYDIGVAVSTPRGLVVPVLRDADQGGLARIEREIADLASRAREGTLGLADLEGAVFTVSNGGVYGSLMSTPILNPPQSGILGMHAIKRRPAVVRDGSGVEQVAIRPMMYLALSYDHRVVDGAQAVTFLKRVVEVVEAPERLLLDG